MSEAVLELGGSNDLADYIGDITPEQVEAFNEQGWVRVPGLIAPELCDRIVERYMEWTGLRWKDWPSDPGDQEKFVAAVDRLATAKGVRYGIRRDDPWMFNFVAQRKLGEVAAKALRVKAIKPLSETIQLKYPVNSGRTRTVTWHQDGPNLPIDRQFAVQTWVALVPVSVDMGPMVHLSGSHREPPMGMMGFAGEKASEVYPWLFDKYETSQPADYAKGDVMLHHSLCWHSSGPNKTDKVRWAMSNYRMSDRCLYTGQQNYNTDNMGLEPNKRFDHPNFPTVYSD